MAKSKKKTKDKSKESSNKIKGKRSPITAYTLGVLSIATAFSFAIVGLVLGIIGIVRSKDRGAEYSRTARILSITGLVLSAIIITLNIIALTTQGLPTTLQ